MTHWNMICNTEVESNRHNSKVECSNYQRAKSLMLDHQRFYPDHKVEVVKLNDATHEWDVGINRIRCVICGKSLEIPTKAKLDYQLDVEKAKAICIDRTVNPYPTCDHKWKEIGGSTLPNGKVIRQDDWLIQCLKCDKIEAFKGGDMN